MADVEAFVGGNEADEAVADVGEEVADAFVAGGHQFGLGEARDDFGHHAVGLGKFFEEFGFAGVLRAVGNGLSTHVEFLEPAGGERGGDLDAVGDPEAGHGQVAEDPGGVVHPGAGLLDHLFFGKILDCFVDDEKVYTIDGKNMIEKRHCIPHMKGEVLCGAI